MALDAYLRKKGVVSTMGPWLSQSDVDNHVCTSKCCFWEHRPTRSFVCKATYRVHECGEKCVNRAVTIEGEVCRLTGFEVGGPNEVFQWFKNRDGKRSLQTHCGSTPASKSKEQQRGETIATWTRSLTGWL